MFVDEGSAVAWELVKAEVGISRELRRKMVFLRTEIAGSEKTCIKIFVRTNAQFCGGLPWSATRSFAQPSAPGESRAFTAGELCFNRPDKVYIALARIDTDEEGDGSKKERRVGSGLHERYLGRKLVR